MKKIICFSLLLLIAFNGYTITRHELHKKFGPKLLEAIVTIIKDEINLLRAQHGLPERTNQQLMNSINNKLGNITDYDWMSN